MGHYCVLTENAETALAEAEGIFAALAKRD
jgi:hypothetical protein